MSDVIATDRQDGDEPGSTRIILTLAIAGLISGLGIVGIYEATFDTIAENRARELREAVFNVLPGISQMQEMVFRNDALVSSEADKDEASIYAGFDDDGRFQGYAIPAAGPGFQDTIGLIYGYRPDSREVVGMQVLESRETPGLGDKIYKDENFVAEFDALSIEPEIILIKGKGPNPNEVDSITGATISSRAIVRIINESNDIWLERTSEVEPVFQNQVKEQ
jgi:electron transport complex protein RnfG